MLAKELRKLLQTKAKTGTQLKTSAVYELMQEQSQVVSLPLTDNWVDLPRANS